MNELPHRFYLTVILLVTMGGAAVWPSAAGAASPSDGSYLTVTYPAGDGKEKAPLLAEANYYLWIPEGVKSVRGIIVHQHGCGEGAQTGGETSALDLHWRTLALKHDCALMGVSYKAKKDCSEWSDPAKGSEQTFLKAIGEFAAKSGHDELKTAPWVLWGHSGGALWASLMFVKYPERTAAVWLRSGSSYYSWFPNDDPDKHPDADAHFTEAHLKVPVVGNTGLKEKNHERFHRGWKASRWFVDALRNKDGQAAFAPDPNTSHECGNSRFLAIPWLDTVLGLRLAQEGKPNSELRAVDPAKGWLGNPESFEIAPFAKYKGNKSAASWLPSEAIARKWQEYISTGMVKDTTPPKVAPEDLKARVVKPASVVLEWEAQADLEGGIQSFVIYRDGKPLVEFPAKPTPGTSAVAQFQKISYHDTPTAPVPKLQVTDDTVKPGESHTYAIASKNSNGAQSPRSKPVTVKVEVPAPEKKKP